MVPPDRSVQLREVEAGHVGSFLAMGSPCEVLCEEARSDDAEVLTRIAADEAWRIEDKFSRYRDGNIIHAINSASGKAVEVDEETARLLGFAATLFELSGGRFDITSGVLRAAWSFDGSDNVPQQSDVDAALKRLGWHRVKWEAPQLILRPGMEIDLGGIGKEYAVDRAVSLLRDASTQSCLVNFGGDLSITTPPQIRDAWSVGIEAIVDGATKVLELRAGAIATSGDARRFLLKDGVRYSHILDPRSGWPVRNAARSITVAADTCTQAGMLSTLAMLKGGEAESFLDGEGVQYWCVR